MSRLRLTTLVCYGAAVGLPGAMEALRIAFLREWAVPHWLVMFLPAVMASATWGGLGPGLVSTVASVLIVMYFELPPRLSLRVEDVAELLGVVVLAGIGLVLSVLARRDAIPGSRRDAAERGEGRL
jgi:K+-sensing histidine kinase KdpD